MQGMQQGMMEAGRELSTVGGRLLEASSRHLGAWDITWTVLGLILWAAVMTALVMGIIALVRHVRKPKDASAKKDASTK